MSDPSASVTQEICSACNELQDNRYFDTCHRCEKRICDSCDCLCEPIRTLEMIVAGAHAALSSVVNSKVIRRDIFVMVVTQIGELLYDFGNVDKLFAVPPVHGEMLGLQIPEEMVDAQDAREMSAVWQGIHSHVTESVECPWTIDVLPFEVLDSRYVVSLFTASAVTRKS